MTQKLNLGQPLDLYVNQGALYSKAFQVLEDNVPVDLSDYAITLYFRPYINSGDISEVTIDIENESSGEINISIEADVTSDMSLERYVYKLVDDNTNKIISTGFILVDRF